MKLAELDSELEKNQLSGFWKTRVPAHTAEAPYLWKCESLLDGLMIASETIGIEQAERRAIRLINPHLPIKSTSHTVQFTFSIVNPGEVARAHRHVAAAIRFVIKGSKDGCTVVEGERFPMHRWDLITTPNWSWHEHVNDSAQDTLWLDGAVAPLIVNFNIGFAEPHQSPQQSVDLATGWSRHQFGALKPRTPRYSTTARRPPYRYSWEETRAALDGLSDAPGDDADDVVLRYADPVTGGPTLLTVDCEIQRLRKGFKGVRKRHTHAVVYHVLEGSGATEVGDRTIEWSAGDTFLVPLWTWRRHRNTGNGPALLFSISDRPVMASLGFDREETAR